MTLGPTDSAPPAALELAVPTGSFRAWRSALELAPHTQAACADIQVLHRLVLEGFRPLGRPTTTPQPPPAHVLFVAERGSPSSRGGLTRAGHPHKVLVQSLHQPDWTHLLSSRRLRSVESLQARNQYTAGQQLDLRVVANPTYREHSTRRRRAITRPEDCAQWLCRTLAAHGLDIRPDHVAVEDPVQLHGKTKQITVVSRYFRARGTVRDPATVHRALATGIGTARAYGCGLLLTAPAPGTAPAPAPAPAEPS